MFKAVFVLQLEIYVRRNLTSQQNKANEPGEKREGRGENIL